MFNAFACFNYILNGERGAIMKNLQGKRMEDSTRNALLTSALVLIVIAAAIRIIVGSTGLADKVAEELKKHGCTISAEDLYQESYSKHSSIAELMHSIDLSEIKSVSSAAGFPSDIDKEGEIYLLLAQLDAKRVLTVFVLDERVELAFIQVLGSDEVFPVNGAGD